jgi:hypothetical protein
MFYYCQANDWPNCFHVSAESAGVGNLALWRGNLTCQLKHGRDRFRRGYIVQNQGDHPLHLCRNNSRKPIRRRSLSDGEK